MSVRTLLSSADGQSMMNYQDGTSSTPLFVAVANGTQTEEKSHRESIYTDGSIAVDP